MNLVKRASSQFQSAAGLSLSDFDRVLDALYGGQPSYTGKLVSQTNSLAVSMVWNCTNILSSDVATTPFIPYNYKISDQGDINKEPALKHYLWHLLLQEANPEITSFRFKQLMQAWLCLWGNAYAEIQTSGRGQVIALWPWRPDRVTVSRAGGEFGQLQYSYRLRNNQVIGPVPAENMLHLRGMGVDGVMGLSPIETFRQTIGLSMAMTEHTGRFYANGARPLGILKSKESLSPKAQESLKQSWIKQHEGLSNAFRVAILEEGLDYSEVGLKQADAQFIETAGLTDIDIARVYNMPGHKVGIMGAATNNNIEQLSLDYINGTLGPWCNNWHEEIERSLLSAREQQSVMVRPSFLQRLRGDHASMSKFVTDLWGRGILNADEIRERYLDMNAQPDGMGKTYYIPVNMAPSGEDNFGQGVQVMQPVKGKTKPDPADATPPTPPPPAKESKPNGKVNGLAHS